MGAKTRPTVMDGYIRVSRRQGRAGPGYISPTLQREAIQRWADYKGATIAEWHVDEDESGGTQDRPGLNAAVDRAVNGDTDGIVAWKIDRFSRFTEGGLRDLRRLEKAGARLAFTTEDIDTSGPIGRLVYTIMLAQSEYFLDQIKAGWIAAKTRAVERGAHIGPTPYGYVRAEDGTLHVAPERGPVVAEAFAVAATGGLQAAVVFLLEHAPERTWTAFTTERFLANRTYLGRVKSGTLVRDGAHEALVTRATFEAANQIEPTRLKRRPTGLFPLSGVASCAGCGGKMIGSRGGADNRRVYRCAARCQEPALVTADLLEAYVVAVLREAFEHPGFHVGAADPGTDEAVAAVEEAERVLDEFAGDTEARRLLGHRYHRALEKHVRAVEQAEERLRDVLGKAGKSRVVVPDEVWDTLEPAELAEVLRGGLDTVTVSRGRRPLSGRVRVVPHGLDGGAVPPAEDADERSLEP